MARVRVPFVVGGIVSALLAAPASAQTAASQAQNRQAASGQLDSEMQRVREELDKLRREFESLRRVYDDRLQQLEQRLVQIGGGPLVVTPAASPAGQTTAPPQTTPPPQTPPPQPTPAPQGPVPVGQGKVFNPDISVNGNFIAAAGRNPFATLSPLQLSEVEAAFQSIVDPYARADFFLAAGSEGVEVEEGYVTFTGLPASLLLKVGKLRAQFGKMNTLHTHQLPTADRPLVTANLMGGDEGLSDAGVSLSHLVRNPYLFLELTGEVYAGQSEVFQSDRRSELAYVGRVRGYRDLSESSNFDVGVSFATGPTFVEPEPPLLTGSESVPTLSAVGLNKKLIGIDATFRYRPLRRAIYQRLNLRTELIWSRQEMPDASEQRAFGLYASGEYQFARRWYIGARADRSGRTFEADAIDKAGSVFLTFWPTEFSQVRGQYRRISFAEGAKANEFLLQFNFSIGAHAAHVF